MNTRDILPLRLSNQRLATPRFRTPLEVVAWLGAVQSQDYPAARWGLGLRAKGVSDADVEAAFDDGSILRTHILRPTWHFVTPADIRWMLALTGPRVHVANGFSYRQHGLDAPAFARSRALFERALEGGKQLTRAELGAILRGAGMRAKGQQLAYLVMRAELDGVLCSGARRGKQFTYALLEERVAPTRPLDRESALAELTRRYVASHGPATVRDYAWWSGLTVREAAAGVELIRHALEQDTVDGRTYWFVPSKFRPDTATATSRRPPTAFLLPNYDEYLIAYRDRDPVSGGAPGAATPDGHAHSVRGKDPFAHHVIIDGRLAGSWRRTLTKGSVQVDVATYTNLRRSDSAAVAAAAERYGRFMNLPVTVSMNRIQ